MGNLYKLNKNRDLKFCILQCSLESSDDRWKTSCLKYNVDYEIIDISRANWLSEVMQSNSDIFLLRPPGMLSYAKQMYDERVYIISKVLKKQVYPSFEESYVYENKRLLSDFLKAKQIPHPQTNIFYCLNEAIRFSKSTKYPIVVKTNIGASGSGVKIIKSAKELIYYSQLAFKKGIQRRKGPNKNSGNPQTWLLKAVKSPQYLLKKLKLYKLRAEDKQKHFVIFQEYIPHEFEWRVVKIGDSYFAHKKAKIGEMASGTKNKIYDNPPLCLFDFMKDVCAKTGFYSQAVDIFETPDGHYLVNEIQTIFGQSDAYQMIVNGQIGRYIYNDGWIFEEGDFNTNESFDLRLEHSISLFNKRVKI
ncbi:MAG: hypothetical protein JW866_10060 [Ignavibacteriales bacterium]|nr:hypothetical protein [Ignavibacteriales bacterium]